MRRYTKLGLAITATWLLLVFVLLIIKGGSVPTMTLNEWGDFLAGVSAPLALLWLVIGYFQHGEELRLNTEALIAQQEELRRQVEETAILAKNSERHTEETARLAQITKAGLDRETLKEIRDAKPEFVSSGGGSSGGNITTHIINRGGEARDIEFYYEGVYQLDFSPKDLFTTDTRGRLTMKDRNESIQYPIQFRIHCTDRLGIKYEIEFEQQRLHHFHEVSHTILGSMNNDIPLDIFEK